MDFGVGIRYGPAGGDSFASGQQQKSVSTPGFVQMTRVEGLSVGSHVVHKRFVDELPTGDIFPNVSYTVHLHCQLSIWQQCKSQFPHQLCSKLNSGFVVFNPSFQGPENVNFQTSQLITPQILAQRLFAHIHKIRLLTNLTEIVQQTIFGLFVSSFQVVLLGQFHVRQKVCLTNVINNEFFTQRNDGVHLKMMRWQQDAFHIFFCQAQVWSVDTIQDQPHSTCFNTLKYFLQFLRKLVLPGSSFGISRSPNMRKPMGELTKSAASQWPLFRLFFFDKSINFCFVQHFLLTCKSVGVCTLSLNLAVEYMAEKYGLAAASTALCALNTLPSTCSSASHRRPCSCSLARPDNSWLGETQYFLWRTDMMTFRFSEWPLLDSWNERSHIKSMGGKEYQDSITCTVSRKWEKLPHASQWYQLPSPQPPPRTKLLLFL